MNRDYFIAGRYRQAAFFKCDQTFVPIFDFKHIYYYNNCVTDPEPFVPFCVHTQSNQLNRPYHRWLMLEKSDLIF